jgi:hypothetical protein
LLLALSSLLWAGAVSAQDFVGVRAMALGEAYRAIATGNDAIYLNPAGLTAVPRYSPELHYSFDLDAEDHQVDLSVVDSKTSAMAGGIGYTFEGRELTRRTTLQHTATVGLAYQFLPQLLSAGVGVKYVNLSDAIVGNYLNALSADVGVLATLPGGLSLAAVGYNLVPINAKDVPLSAGFGAALDLGPLSSLLFGGGPVFGPMPNAAGVPAPVPPGNPRGPLSNFVLTADWYINFFTLYGPQNRISAGWEYLFLDAVPLRLGYQYDEARGDHVACAGAGFIVPYFGLDVGFQQSVVDLERRSFGLSLKFFFDV